MKKRTFEIETVLTITTGRLVCPIGDVYDILNFLTRDNLMTHQLPRAGRECAPWLLRWFPDLGKVTTGLLDQLLLEAKEAREPPGTPREAIRYWIDIQVSTHRLPRMFELEPIPQDDHERKDAYDELVEMRGTDEEIILVNMTPGDPA